MDVLDHIGRILAARTADEAWESYVQPLNALGFPHLVYVGHRLIGSLDQRIINEELRLSTLPAVVTTRLAQENLLDDLPMTVWITHHHGSESWDWLHPRRAKGRLTPREARCFDILTKQGHGAGIAISLSDRAPRIRAGILLIGAGHLPQAEINRRWHRGRRDAELLTTVLHQRLANLPYHQLAQVLTLRQREVLELTGFGFTMREIAARMGVAGGTVEKHLRLARKAIGARTTAQALLLAVSRRQIFADPGEGCDPRPPKAKAANGKVFEPWTDTDFKRGGAAPQATD